MQAYETPQGGYAFVSSPIRNFDGFVSPDGYLPANWSTLLEFPAYQDELLLSAAQRKAINAALHQASTKLTNAYRNRPQSGSGFEELMSCVTENELTTNDMLAKLLSPEQRTRFEQLIWQVRLRARGISQCMDVGAIAECKLSSKQILEAQRWQQRHRQQLIHDGELLLNSLHQATS